MNKTNKQEGTTNKKGEKNAENWKNKNNTKKISLKKWPSKFNEMKLTKFVMWFGT